jgi:PTS system galactitol-specific IIB component
MLKIYVVCGSGIATSSMVKVKVEQFLEDHKYHAQVTTHRVTELKPTGMDCDLIVTTVTVPPEIAEVIPVINAVPFLTGVGKEKVQSQLLDFITKKGKK